MIGLLTETLIDFPFYVNDDELICKELPAILPAGLKDLCEEGTSLILGFANPSALIFKEGAALAVLAGSEFEIGLSPLEGIATVLSTKSDCIIYLW